MNPAVLMSSAGSVLPVFFDNGAVLVTCVSAVIRYSAGVRRNIQNEGAIEDR